MRFDVKLPCLGLLSLLAACATAPVDQNARACEPLPVADCLTVLKEKGLPPKTINAALLAVAQSHLSEKKPEPAIEYLDVLKGRGDSAVTYRTLGDAFTMLAGQNQTRAASVNDLLSQANYVIASANYMLASTKDPSDQANYIDATRTAVLAGACEVAELTRGQHEKRFGKNDRQRELAALVHQKCG
jgi:hypothetical protein